MERRDLPCLTSGAATHEGLQRAVNEDCFLTDTLLCLVADGMGGHEAGDVASALATEVIGSAFRSGPPGLWELETIVERAHDRLREPGRSQGRSMGTTVVGVAVVDNGGSPAVVVFNVGDSRCYRVVGDVVTQVTVDHSHVQELIDAGELTPESAHRHPLRNVVTRALGTSETARPDVVVLPDQPCRLLLCSDGVSSEVGHAMMHNVLTTEADPAIAARRLVELVLEGPAPDNATAVVVDIAPAVVAHSEHSFSAGVSGITSPRDVARGVQSSIESSKGDVES